jgi:hypothetical protein
MHWKTRFDSEIRRAEQARLGGKEGLARVCARRAGALVVAEYYRRRGQATSGTGALDLLGRLRSEALLPPQLVPTLDHLLQQVDREFNLPPGVDLLAEARRLAEHLLHD